jgi:AmiR/NasT family two-component response regulator
MALTEPSVEALQSQVRDLQAQCDHLKIALETSRQIGTAIGILMASRDLAEDEAFELMIAASNASHRKLRDIADRIVGTGRLVTGLPAHLPNQRSQNRG